MEARAGGADVFGYVATGFGPPGNADGEGKGKPLDVVEAQISTYFDPSYYRWAGVQVTGIFLDEMSNNTANIDHYHSIYKHIRTQSATARVIGNPGLNVDESFLNDIDGPTADTLIIFEGNGASYASWTPDAWVTSGNYTADHFAHIIHSESSSSRLIRHVERAKRLNAGMIYVTDDLFEPNPFDDLATYWPAQVRQAMTSEPATLPLLLLLGGVAVSRTKRGRR